MYVRKEREETVSFAERKRCEVPMKFIVHPHLRSILVCIFFYRWRVEGCFFIICVAKMLKCDESYSFQIRFVEYATSG